LDSVERVIASITFGKPDRIPTDLWPLPTAFMRHGGAMDELVDKYPIDFVRRRCDVNNLDGRMREGEYTDEWGCVWLNHTPGIFGMVVKYPLEDYRALDTLKPPFDWLKKSVENDTAAHPEPGKFWNGWGGDFFHRMCWMRGMENVMYDLMDGRSEVYRLRDILLDFFGTQVSMVVKSDVNGVCFADDFGSQQQLLLPPKLWREFIKPVYKELVGICKSAGKYVFFHSDGVIHEIIDDLIEIGVDALNSQIWCMGGPEEVGSRFAGRIAFWGELDRQQTVPYGTPDDIRAAAERMKKSLCVNGAGLIGQAEVDGLTSIENIEAILTAWN